MSEENNDKPVNVNSLVEEHMADVPADQKEAVLEEFDAAQPATEDSEEDDSDKEGPAYIVVNADPDDPDVKAGVKPYRHNLSIFLYGSAKSDVPPRQQVLLVTKYRRYVTPCAALELGVNTRFEEAEGAIDGLPNYTATHQGCHIHCVNVPVLDPNGQPIMKDDVPVTTHVVPDKDGLLRGAMEINLRVATKLEPISLEDFQKLDEETRKLILEKDPEIEGKLEDPDKLSPRQFLELPLEVMVEMTHNEFNSVNVYPVDPKLDPKEYVDEIMVARIARVDPQSDSRQDRQKAREQMEENRSKLLQRMARRGGKMRRFGPDRNESYIFVT